jgi:hypothetical protein
MLQMVGLGYDITVSPTTVPNYPSRSTLCSNEWQLFHPSQGRIAVTAVGEGTPFVYVIPGKPSPCYVIAVFGVDCMPPLNCT